VNISKETVTPKKAMEWLKRNIANRPLSPVTVNNYARAMSDRAWKLNGDCVRFNGNGDLVDGQHRLTACVKSGQSFETYIVRGRSVRDAILFAAGANSAHGLRRTNADKRHSVEVLLKDDEWAKWSDRVIAEKCGVSHPFVADVRSQVETVTTDRKNGAVNGSKRIGRDGIQQRSRKRKKTKPVIPAADPSDDESEPEPQPAKKPPTPLDRLKHWWKQADATQQTLFRLWIDGEDN
jgi:hypothetical protein